MKLGLCFITNQTVLCGQAKDLLKPADHFSLFVVVQSLSHVHLFTTPWTAVCQASLSFTIPCSLLKLMSIESVMPSSHLILCRPLSFSVILCHPLLLLLQSFPASGSFPMNQFFTSRGQSIEYSGLISFRIEWLDLLAVQGTLKSLLQHDSPITSWQINGETMKTVRDFTFLGLEY